MKLLLTSSKKKITGINVASGAIYETSFENACINKMHTLKNGNFILSLEDERKIRLFNKNTLKEIEVFTVKSCDIHAFTEVDDNIIAFGDYSGHIEIFDFTMKKSLSREPIQFFIRSMITINSMIFSGDYRGNLYCSEPSKFKDSIRIYQDYNNGPIYDIKQLDNERIIFSSGHVLTILNFKTYERKSIKANYDIYCINILKDNIIFGDMRYVNYVDKSSNIKYVGGQNVIDAVYDTIWDIHKLDDDSLVICSRNRSYLLDSDLKLKTLSLEYGSTNSSCLIEREFLMKLNMTHFLKKHLDVYLCFSFK